MYHDALPSECQTRLKSVVTSSHIIFSLIVHKQLSVSWHRISRRPPTKEDQFLFHAISCRICSEQNDTVVVSLRLLLFRPSGSFLQCFMKLLSFTHVRACIFLAVESVFEENIALTSAVAEHVISAFCVSTLRLCD